MRKTASSDSKLIALNISKMTVSGSDAEENATFRIYENPVPGWL